MSELWRLNRREFIAGAGKILGLFMVGGGAVAAKPARAFRSCRPVTIVIDDPGEISWIGPESLSGPDMRTLFQADMRTLFQADMRRALEPYKGQTITVTTRAAMKETIKERVNKWTRVGLHEEERPRV